MGKSKKRPRQKASFHHPYRKTAITSSKSRPVSKSACNLKSSVQYSRSPTIPFSKSDKILLVGEGDFSFSHSLLTHHHCTSITATSYDPLPALLSKYPQSSPYIHTLTSAGQTILHGIDATKLGRPGNIGGGGGRKRIPEGGFDRVIFNFPHTGGLTKDVNRQVRANQELLVGFFKAAIPLLKRCSSRDGESSSPPLFSTSANGILLSSSSFPRRRCSLSPSALPAGSPHGPPTIIVTLFDGEPYTLWNIRDLARHVGLAVKRSFAFDFGAYPGYVHQRTLGNVTGGWKGEEKGARCFVLEVPGQEGQGGEEGQRKRNGGGENDDDSE